MTLLFRVVLPVKNLQQAVTFYRGLLGSDGERISPGWHYFTLGSCVLACHDADAEGDAPGLPHTEPLYLAVDESVVQLRVRMTKLEPRSIDEQVGLLPTGESGFRMQDPSGNTLCVVDSRTLVRGRERSTAPARRGDDAFVLQFRRDFLNAVKGGELARVRELLALDPQLIETTDEGGVSVLMLAGYKRHERLAAYLLSQRQELTAWEAAAFGLPERLRECLNLRPDITGEVSSDGFTLLGLASFFGQFECVALLIEQGADVNAPSRNAQEVCPVHSCLRQAPPSQALPILQLLLAAGANPNAVKPGGHRPLHLAAERGNLEMVDLLLAAGADAAARADNGRTAYALARARGEELIMARLSGVLKFARADLGAGVPETLF